MGIAAYCKRVIAVKLLNKIPIVVVVGCSTLGGDFQSQTSLTSIDGIADVSEALPIAFLTNHGVAHPVTPPTSARQSGP